MPDPLYTPITQERWDQLTGKQKWDIKVALRGPDVTYSETIKWFSTSIIRHAMSGIERVGGLINSDLKVCVVPYPLPFYKETGLTPSYDSTTGEWKNPTKTEAEYPQFAFWCASHFFQHVTEASEIIGIPIAYAPKGEWQTAMAERPKKAIKTLIPAIKALDMTRAKLVEELERHQKWLEGLSW